LKYKFSVSQIYNSAVPKLGGICKSAISLYCNNVLNGIANAAQRSALQMPLNVGKFILQ